MSFLEVLEAISDYSLSIILSGIVIYVVIRFINLGFTKLEKGMGNKKHDKLLAMRSEIDVEVHSIISEFLTLHKGTRIQVIEFTNSVTSVAYLPFKYMSCTYEVISYGAKPEAKRIDKLSTSLFGPFLSQLSKEGTMVLDEATCHRLSGSVEDIFTQMGSAHQLCAILRTQKTKSIGFVCLCKEDEVTLRDQSDIKMLASQLSALLGVLDN